MTLTEYANEKWLLFPREYICSTIENKTDYSLEAIKLDFEDKIKNYKGKFPLLNYTLIDNIPTGSLVCFRGFVNDIRNPGYTVKSSKIPSDKGSFVERFLLFSDVMEHADNNLEAECDNLIEKQSFQLCSLMHENNWVCNELESRFTFDNKESGVKEINMQVYGSMVDLQLHDIVEAYGVFENIIFDCHATENESNIVTKQNMFSLHCLYVKVLSHPSPFSHIISKEFMFNTCREALLSHLTKTLYGDKLAAKFLLLNMISYVGIRVPQRPIGKFVVNLCFNDKISDEKSVDLCDSLKEFASNFLSHSFIYKLTHETLNSDKLCLTRNYENGLLEGNNFLNHNGIYTIIDETKLTECSLGDTACKNIIFLKELIQFQKTAIDFVYYKIDYDRDIPILLLSKGSSILPCDSRVIWKPTTTVTTYDESTVSLSLIRHFFTSIRQLEFSINNEEEELIQRCYVNSANKSRLDLNEDRLHVLLTMARLITKSYGYDKLQPNFWQEVMEMELERCLRLQKHTIHNEEEFIDR